MYGLFQFLEAKIASFFRKLRLLSWLTGKREKMCEHLEVNEFGTYSLDVGGGVQAIHLQRCVECGEYLTLDSKIVPKNSIIERISLPKENMRTLRVDVNREVYEKLQELISQEIGDESDPALLMSEIVAMGLNQYRRMLSRHSSLR
jgi:hypothetical protein